MIFNDTFSDADFGRLSWHDNLIYGLRLDIGDPDRGTWHSRLIVDIDYIAEWLSATDDKQFRFSVAPATLTFHNVTDLKIAMDYGAQFGADHQYQVNLNEMSIDGIERTQQPKDKQKTCLDRAYYRWRIALNVPTGGEITFGASDFDMELRAAPVLCDEQRLPAGTRD